MSTELLIASYLRIANQDLKDALLLEANQSPNAIYHCEQAAEKIIKAVLTSEGLLAGYTQQHQLRLLVDKIPNENPLKPQLRLIEGLTRYATSHRYPNTFDAINKPPDANEFATFAKKVEVALTEAVNRFGVDLSHKSTPASNKNPIR